MKSDARKSGVRWTGARRQEGAGRLWISEQVRKLRERYPPARKSWLTWQFRQNWGGGAQVVSDCGKVAWRSQKTEVRSQKTEVRSQKNRRAIEDKGAQVSARTARRCVSQFTVWTKVLASSELSSSLSLRAEGSVEDRLARAVRGAV